MGCRFNFPLPLKELPDYVVTLDDSLNDDVVVIGAEQIPMAPRHTIDIEFLIMDIGYHPISCQFNDMNRTNPILSHIYTLIISKFYVDNITKSWVLPKNMDLSFVKRIMTASKINQYLLPYLSFTGFNFISPIYQILPVAQALCDNNDFIILFATDQDID
jgi:hypothetical protein